VAPWKGKRVEGQEGRKKGREDIHLNSLNVAVPLILGGPAACLPLLLVPLFSA